MSIDFETLDLIEERYKIDPETGIIRWKLFCGANRPGDIAGYQGEDGYIRITVNGRSYPAHHVAWFLYEGRWPSYDREIDHRNRVRSDNSRGNLREVTREENQDNRGLYRTNQSGFVGVRQRGSRWIAEICHQGRKHFIGTFASLEEAVSMRQAVVEGLQ